MNEEKFQIIPSIDLIDGICVRLSQGIYQCKKLYHQDPLYVSLYFQDLGISRLHIVDLDGAKSGKIVHWNILEKISNNTDLIIDFSGGIQDDQDVKVVFECGANIVTLGSIAVKKTLLIKKWIKKYGSEKILLGIDVNNKKIAINGWKKMTNIYYYKFLKKIINIGVVNFFFTDISKDGLLRGLSFQFYEGILMQYPGINIVASGGLSYLTDIQYIKYIGCCGTILGKALYENKIIISNLKKNIKKC